jgi:hypothetical protein
LFSKRKKGKKGQCVGLREVKTKGQVASGSRRRGRVRRRKKARRISKNSNRVVVSEGGKKGKRRERERERERERDKESDGWLAGWLVGWLGGRWRSMCSGGVTRDGFEPQSCNVTEPDFGCRSSFHLVFVSNCQWHCNAREKPLVLQVLRGDLRQCRRCRLVALETERIFGLRALRTSLAFPRAAAAGFRVLATHTHTHTYWTLLINPGLLSPFPFSLTPANPRRCPFRIIYRLLSSFPRALPPSTDPTFIFILIKL